MISPRNERIFIRDLSDLTLPISFDAWWDSMNVGWNYPIAWIESSYASSRVMYLHCGIEETRQPWIHMYRLSSSTSPSIRTGNQIIVEPVAAQSSNLKVEQVNRVGSYLIDPVDGQ